MEAKWINKYIGIPYAKFGRDFSGCDCFGLLHLVYRKEFNHTLPDFINDYSDKESMRDLINYNIPILAGTPTDEPELGDIVVFNFFNMPIHLGIYINKNLVLHTLEKSDSCVERMNSHRLKGRLHGFYKYKR